MILQKKGKFWVGTFKGRIVYYSRSRPAEQEDTNVKLVEILCSLHSDCDKHWTRAGLPSMHYVEQQLGDSTITRQDVKAAVPGLDRSNANA